MQLNDLLGGVPLTSTVPANVLALEVGGLAYDSRRVGQDFLFFAFAGAKVDGAQFANAAVAKGAIAVVSDRPRPSGFSRPWIQVAHGRHALAIAARNFYGKPDERIALTGVTGTNGKTTSSMLLDSMLRAAGKITALIGTIEYHLAGRVLPAVNTTPESLDLFRMFHELEQAGGTHATLEASSHALDLGRIYAMNFHTAAFTNFTRDHLDYHHTMEAYFAAKQLLFTAAERSSPRFAVLNARRRRRRRAGASPETEVFGTAWSKSRRRRLAASKLRVRANIESSFDGLRFQVVAPKDRNFRSNRRWSATSMCTTFCLPAPRRLTLWPERANKFRKD